MVMPVKREPKKPYSKPTLSRLRDQFANSPRRWDMRAAWMVKQSNTAQQDGISDAGLKSSLWIFVAKMKHPRFPLEA